MMSEPDYTDPNRYASAEAATRELCRRIRVLAELEQIECRQQRRDLFMVTIAAVFLYGQLFAAWLKVI